MSTGKLKDKIQYLDRLSEDNLHLLSDNPDYTTVILGQEEAYWSNLFKDDKTETKLISNYISRAKNLSELPDIKMVVCGYKYDDLNLNGLDDIAGWERNGLPWAERVQWKTYWFGAEVCLDFRTDGTERDDNCQFNLRPPEKLVSCFLNNGHKMHRVCMMRSMVNNGLLDKGIFRFCNSDTAWVKFLSQVNMEREHGGPHISLLDSLLPYMNNLFSQRKWGSAGVTGVGFDQDYHLGCIDIVGASNVEVPMFCEKTARPLLFGKPFFLVGPPGINNMLTEMGFELYDEIFDYSMDNYVRHGSNRKAYTDYYDKMLRPVYDLDGTPKCIKHITDITKEKTQYNQKRIVDIIFDDSFIPYVFPEHLKNHHYEMGVQWARKILARSEHYSKYLSKNQIKDWHGE